LRGVQTAILPHRKPNTALLDTADLFFPEVGPIIGASNIAQIPLVLGGEFDETLGQLLECQAIPAGADLGGKDCD
jgi:hypothetical protein